MLSYLDVVYKEETKPITDYPLKLCSYLSDRFKMEKGDKLLDIGCGRGDFLKGFKDIGLDVFGLDIEKSKSDIVKNIKIYNCNFELNSFPLENNSVDFIFSKSVIEHLKNPENFIKEIYRVLKPGGTAILMTPDWQSQMKIFYDDYTHVRPYTRIGLEDFLKMSGFKNVSSEIFYQLPILWKLPWLKIFSKSLQIFGPVKRIHRNKFIRWSKELMILGHGEK
ncbi:MAG: class I SAM-dependent methyltransferase [Candidatus Staskawiczbacteria bacterium]|jgi:ubiquinone/menaquinone biosynthesis C-methylase UbiE